MTISDDTLNSMNERELKDLAARATAVVRRRGLETALQQNLRPMVQHLITAITAEQAKPETERRRFLDFSVTQAGFYHADDVLATPGYKEAIAAISQKYGVVVTIYQGTTYYSACGHRESEPDARVKVDMMPEPAVRDGVEAVMKMIQGA